MELLFDDCDEHVGGHGTPDLRLHRVLAGAQKALGAQVLLDPLEEQVDLPLVLYSAAIVRAGNAVLLVMNTSVLPDCGFLKRMRRGCPG